MDPDLEQLTPRQREIARLLEDRLTIKEIAGALDISESAVNQHVARIKLRLGVNSLREIAEWSETLENPAAEEGCRKPAYTKNDLPERDGTGEEKVRDARVDMAVFHDAVTFDRYAPWERSASRSVVPRVLDGPHGTVWRIAAILGLAFGMLALVMVGLGVAQGVTEALESDGPAPRNQT
ncbi:helix-turn-helix domain-containing protein [Novosphingobium marinum]|uniref:DNA-binding CsgD family transcriptional regulator n=1 Tax=Novosphingobium marinum TaxID=1514948 RepID=A0A7Y9XXN0_9SPHN|nr:helix-turn-helix transcriptional regulator [Novosphingobium marinum]NYH96310.1 DNA-binding CsgD family transcriptional regulator [Novosphingobium marinum]